MPSNYLVLVQYLGYFTFFAELFVIQLLFMRRFPKRSFFALKTAACSAVAIAFVFLPRLAAGFYDFSFIIVLAYTIGAACLLFKANFVNCFFYGLAAWAAQHTAWSVFLILCMTVKMPAVATAVIYYIIFAVIYTAIFFAFSFRRKDYLVKRERATVVASSAILLLLTTLIYDMAMHYDKASVWYALYGAISCILVLIVQFGITSKEALINKSERLENEKSLLEGLLYSQSKQQKLSSETVEIINRKCHDLKYQVRMLRSAGRDGERYIDEIEKAVMIYGDIAKTGNNALDVTLTEKCLLCNEHGVKFTYMIDGESLDVLCPTDVSALFGNILDNAIESVMREDEERRIIRLNVSVVQGYLRIHSENYCSEQVEFRDGLPVSERESTGYHGFGTKTIRYIAEKYGGNVVMDLADELFNVNIILPLKA